MNCFATVLARRRLFYVVAAKQAYYLSVPNSESTLVFS